MAHVWFYGPHEKRDWDDADERHATMIKDPELTFGTKKVKTTVVLKAILDAVGASEYSIDQSKLDEISDEIQAALDVVGSKPAPKQGIANPFVERNDRPMLTHKLNGEDTLDDFRESFEDGLYDGQIVKLKAGNDRSASRFKITGYNTSKPSYPVEVVGLDPPYQGKQHNYNLEFLLDSMGLMSKHESYKHAFIEKYGTVYNQYFTTPFIYKGQPYTIVGYNKRTRKYPIILKTLTGTIGLKDFGILNTYIRNE